MRRVAWVYVIGIMMMAILLSVVAFIVRPTEPTPEILFVTITLITTLLLLSVVISPNRKAYEGCTIGLMAGVLLLPPWLFALQVIIAHGLQLLWFRLRNPNDPHLRHWYIQPFNISKCIISGMAAYWVLSIWPLPGPGQITLVNIATIVLTGVTYVSVNQIVLGVVLKLARGISFREAGIFRDALLIEMPLVCIGYVVVILIRESILSTMFILAPVALIYQAFMLPKVQDEAMKALEGMNKELTEANQSIRRLNEELFRALAKVFDMRDPFVGGHAAQVATYAVAIATEMGLKPQQIELVRQAAFLHDIGKLAIPEAILHKPGKLSETEYNFVKKHSDIGADLLASTEGLQHLAPLIRHHHERWDGDGYPCGLAGESIPLESRILNLCDSVEAMASDRPYHRSMSTQSIIKELRRCSGTQFDPLITDVFINLLERNGASFVVNSARSVTQQYAASILADESFVKDMFAWVLEDALRNQNFARSNTIFEKPTYEMENVRSPQQSVEVS